MNSPVTPICVKTKEPSPRRPEQVPGRWSTGEHFAWQRGLTGGLFPSRPRDQTCTWRRIKSLSRSVADSLAGRCGVKLKRRLPRRANQAPGGGAPVGTLLGREGSPAALLRPANALRTFGLPAGDGGRQQLNTSGGGHTGPPFLAHHLAAPSVLCPPRRPGQGTRDRHSRRSAGGGRFPCGSSPRQDAGRAEMGSDPG